MVGLSQLCLTGGIVNAYDALKLAASVKGERKPAENTPSRKPLKK